MTDYTYPKDWGKTRENQNEQTPLKKESVNVVGNITFTPNASYMGWICPKCGRVYSPSILLCAYCVAKADVTCSDSTATKDIKE